MKIEIEFKNRADLEAQLADLLDRQAPAAAAPATNKRKRRTKAEIEAEKKAAEAAAAAETAAAEPEPPATEPEPEPPAEPVTVAGAAVDVDEVRDRFKNFVGDHYDEALKMVEALECKAFDDVVEAGKLHELAAAMDAFEAAA